MANCHQLKLTSPKDGKNGNVASNARKEIESQTGRPVVTSKTAVELGFVMTEFLSSANDLSEENA